MVTVREYECGCKITTDKNYPSIEHCPLHKSAPELYEACKNLPEPKSILVECAYTGGDIPKKWMNDRGHFIDGYNQALKEVRELLGQALTKAEGGK